MEAATHLRPVRDDDLLVNPASGEPTDASYRVRDLEDQNAGLVKTVEKQARMIGQLERRVTEEEDPNSHPKGAEIVSLIERWREATDHPNAKVSADRVKLIKSRLRDGYSIEQLELAIDGLGVNRYVVAAQRRSEGQPSQRYDQLSHALKSGESVERFANLGAIARRQGVVTWAE